MDDLLNLDNLSLDDLGDLGDLDDVDLDNIDLSDLDLSELGLDDPEETKIREPFSDDGVEFDFDELLKEQVSTPATNVGESIPVQEEADALAQEEEDVPAQEEEDVPAQQEEENVPAQEEVSAFAKKEEDSSIEDFENTPNMDLDDLFQALGIEDEPSEDEPSYDTDISDIGALGSLESVGDLEGFNGLEGIDALDALDDIQDISEVKGKKKVKKNKSSDKKSLSRILFGEPDEDDLEEEKYLAEKRLEKQEKKAKKQELNAEKKAQKEEKSSVKKAKALQKKNEKLEKKKARNQEFEEESANEKKVSTPVVAIVFAAFAIFAAFVVFGTKEFNYSQVIRKATDYFERQRYRLAYDEVSGVEVKEKDEELKDRIYTVMYVERLYESYENNIQLGRVDKALDALIRGVQKYDEHYEEAVELHIVNDINICKEKIINALWNTYKMTEEDAYDFLALDGQEYTDALRGKCNELSLGE